MKSFKKHFVTRLLIVIALTYSSITSAEIYKWADENGRTHFSDSKPEQTGAEALVVKPIINTYTSPEISILPPQNETVSPRSRQVVMYSATWCSVCDKARAYFRQHNIAFREYDIENSRKGRRDFDRFKGKGVPIILVGKKRLNGFNASSFEKIYVR